MTWNGENTIEECIAISNHATRRAQQRGVRNQSIVLTALHGEKIDAVGGCVRRTMTRKMLRRLEKSGQCPKLLEEAYGTVVITLDSVDERLVLTVRPSERRGNRRGGFVKPKQRYHFADSRATYRNREFGTG